MASVQTDRTGSVNSSSAIKVPCRVATTADLTPSLSQGALNAGGGGLFTIDGVALNAGDRVLVKNQTDQTTNGIWLAATTSWLRDVDAQDNRALVKGTLVLVTDGTLSGGLFFELTTANPITIGSSNITFAVTSNPTIGAAMSPVVGAATLAAARTAMGVAIGTNVEAQSAFLDDVAGIVWAQGDVMYYNGTHLVRLAASTSGQALLTKGAAANPAWSGVPVVIGSMRNLLITRASNTTLSIAADEVVVETALGGTAYKSGAISHTLNAATTGANGMDTGSQPTSGYLSIYEIYNPATNTFACIGTVASQTSVYGGGSLPSGFTASALIGLWPCGAGPAFAVGTQFDRKFWYDVAVNIVTGATVPTSMTSQSISAGVPAVAKTAFVLVGQTNNSATPVFFAVAGDANGIGAVMTGLTGSATAGTFLGFASAIWAEIPMITAQTIFWETTTTPFTAGRISVTGFTF